MKQTTKMTRSLLVGLLLVLASFVVAAEVSTTAHDADVELEPEWSQPSEAMEYDANITNFGPDRVRQVWIYKNKNYTDFECPERTGWQLNEYLDPNFVDTPDLTDTTEACQYVALAGGGGGFSASTSRVFEFNATTPESGGPSCDLPWYIETIDSYSGTQGEAELHVVTTSIDENKPEISSVVNSPKVDYKGDTYISPEYADNTSITVTADDTREEECQSGIDYCEWYYERTTTDGTTQSGVETVEGNGAASVSWDVTFPQDSKHTLVVNCVDVAGNEADEHTRDVIVDGTPPETTYETTGPIHYDTWGGNDAVWFDSVNTITFDATDNKFDREGITTQYRHFYYPDEEDWDECKITDNELLDGITGASDKPFVEYQDEFTLDGFNESCNVIEYKSYDKLTNVEETKFLRFFVDKTPPQMEKTVDEPKRAMCDYREHSVSGSTMMAAAGYGGSAFDFTQDNAGYFGWNSFDVTVTTNTDGTVDFDLTMPRDLYTAPDNFDLVFDADNDGTPDFLVHYYVDADEKKPVGTHWSFKENDGGWGNNVALPSWISASPDTENEDEFTVTVDAEYLGGCGAEFGYGVQAPLADEGSDFIAGSGEVAVVYFPENVGDLFGGTDNYEKVTLGNEMDWHVTTETDITLSCTDVGPHPSGDETAYWRINRTTDGSTWSTSGWQSAPAGTAFTFGETSLHSLEWYCEDAVEKQSAVDLEYFKVDDEAPVLDKVIVGPHMGADCPADTDQLPENGDTEAECYLDGDNTTINLSAADYMEGGAAVHYSGLDVCEWTLTWENEVVNNGAFGPGETAGVRFQHDSQHILNVTCVDNVGNEMNDVEYFLVDMEPPTTDKTYGHPNVLIWNDKLGYDYRWVTSGTPITITAEDEKVGVETLYYAHKWVSNETCPAHPEQMLSTPADTTSGWDPASTNEQNIADGDKPTVTMLDSNSTHVTLELHTPRSFIACFEIRTDGDASQDVGTDNPIPAIPDRYPAECLNDETRVVEVEADSYVEVRHTFGAEADYRFDWVRFDLGPNWQQVDGDEVTFTIPESSCHVIQYYAEDKFGHVSHERFQYVMVDNEAPDFTKEVGEPSIFIGEGGDAGNGTEYCTPSDFGGQVSPGAVDGALLTDGSCMIDKDVTTGTTAAADPEVYFLVDTTGSMSGPISAVKADIGDILDSLDADYGAGQYKDFPFDSFAYQHEQSITSDKSAVESAINGMSATGGNDGSEGQFYALQQIADGAPGFGTDATKIVVWFGDAPGHDPICNAISGEADIDEASVTAALQAAGIRVIAISTTSGYVDGLDDDPTSDASDYAGDCAISGTSGQATRIADATGGVHLTDVESDDIVDAITNAIGDITSTTDVVPDASACEALGIDVGFSPESHTNVSAETTVEFDETITRTDSADGTVICDVLFRSGEGGGVIGTQTLTIGVPTGDGGGLDWYVNQDTQVSLSCEDVLPHPVGNETLSFKVSFEGDSRDGPVSYLTEEYCAEYGGTYDNETEVCEIDSAELNMTFLEDSIHNLEAWCTDGLGNENDVDIEWFAVDTLAPETELDITEPVYEDDGVTWADTATRYELDAEDPQPHPSGLDTTYYRWNLVEDESFCWGTNESEYVSAIAGFDQGFENNEDGWLDYLGANLTMVPSGTNGVTSAEGSSHATLSLGDLQSGGAYDGRRLSVFSRWGGYENVFPVGGYTTQVDVYLDTAWADGTDKRLDFSSAINTPAGDHQRDFIIHIGTEVSAGEFAVSSSNNAPGWARGAGDKQIINESGWYTLRHTFANNGGDLEVTYEVIEKSSGDVVYSRTQLTSDEIGTDVGGNRYGWFVVNEFEDLPIDNTEKSGLNVVAWNEYDGQFAIPEESCHVIEYFSVDNLGNTEMVNTEFVFVDKTPPMIEKTYEGPYYANEFYNESREEWYVAKFIHPDDTNVLVSVEDVGPHPSGVAEAEYRITRVDDENCRYYDAIRPGSVGPAQATGVSGATEKPVQTERFQCDAEGEGDWTPFTGDLNVTVGEDSCHVIEVRARDNVDKEAEHTQCVFVDGQAPTPNKTVGDPHTLLPQDYPWTYYSEHNGECNVEDGIDCWKVTTMTPIEMACEDPQPHPVGNEYVYFNVDLDGSQVYDWNLDHADMGDSVTETYCEEYGGDYNESSGYCKVDGDAVQQFLFMETTEHKLSYYCEDVLGNSNVEDQDVEMFKVEEEAFEIELNKKWNLISVPFRLLNEDMEAVFDPHSDTVISVWGYNGTDWSVYTPDGVNNDDLNAMLPGYGYWVLTNGSSTLSIGGSLFTSAITPPSIDVVPGWNLLGYWGTENRTEYIGPELAAGPYSEPGDTVACHLNSLQSSLLEEDTVSVLSYWEPFNPNSWETHRVGDWGLRLDDRMDPGAGYWVQAFDEGKYEPSSICGGPIAG